VQKNKAQKKWLLRIHQGLPQAKNLAHSLRRYAYLLAGNLFAESKELAVNFGFLNGKKWRCRTRRLNGCEELQRRWRGVLVQRELEFSTI
jgi:hypothetical protein